MCIIFDIQRTLLWEYVAPLQTYLHCPYLPFSLRPFSPSLLFMSFCLCLITSFLLLLPHSVSLSSIIVCPECFCSVHLHLRSLFLSSPSLPYSLSIPSSPPLHFYLFSLLFTLYLPLSLPSLSLFLLLLLFSLSIHHFPSFLLPNSMFFFLPPSLPGLLSSHLLSLHVFHLSTSGLLSTLHLLQQPSLFVRERERWYHAGITAIQFWHPPSAVETQRARGTERQTVWKRHGDVKCSEGEIIFTPCTVYPLQSISSLSLFSSSSWRESSLSPNSSSLIFSPLPLFLSSPTVWYSRHAAFSRWSNSFAAATSRPFSPRQPSISYWCASERGERREGEGREGELDVRWCRWRGEQGEAPEWKSTNTHLCFNPYEVSSNWVCCSYSVPLINPEWHYVD